MDVRWHEAERAGTRLACADYGGEGPPALLLHGLAGHAREWDSTAAWLTRSHRVLAPDGRAHGRSARSPVDVSPEAFVLDAQHWLRLLARGPAVVVGQSLGGLTALVLAASSPDLVSGLVVAEATPEADPDAVGAVRRWLASWPLPFPSAGRAREFFGGDTLRARAWTSGLERRADGLWPAFEPGVLVRALADAEARSYWDEWASIRCPALIVRASTGARPDEARRMADLKPGTGLSEIEDAGHDVHLDQPERWRTVLLEFMATLG